MLCESRHDVDRQLIGFGQFTRPELDLTFHLAVDEVNISSQSVQFGDQECGTWLDAYRRGVGKIERPLSGTKFDSLEFRYVVGSSRSRCQVNSSLTLMAGQSVSRQAISAAIFLGMLVLIKPSIHQS
jgi:hypothetical protein